MIASTEFAQRRVYFAEQMTDNSVAVFPAAKELTRSRDTEFPFRQNSDFYYLTGFPEPDAWLIITKNEGEVTSSLVCRVKDKLAEIWHGRRIGKEAAKADFAFDHTADETELHQELHKALNNKQTLYWAQGEYSEADNRVFELLTELRSAPKKGWNAPTEVIDPRPIVHNMRLLKSEAEIAIMRQAGIISANAHKRAMQFSASKIAQGKTVTEFQLEAEIHHEFAMNGARYPAYGTIVGSGENACILHYTENESDIRPTDLVLIDAGCELQGYAADITRTFPANGKFSTEQKAIYQLVLHTQEQVLEQIKPGTNLKALTDLSVRLITEGLVELGILSGSVDELIANNAHRAYYMHGLAHWIGLDVHDVGDYNQKGAQRPLEPGMVFTVEPGIYIDSNSDCDPKWHGIGVRIEDNIVITKDGSENLTASVPKSVAEIEALMA